MVGKSSSMHSFVGRQSNLEDLEGDSEIISFTVFSSTVSKGKDGKFGINTSVCCTTEETSGVKLSKLLLMTFTLFRKAVRNKPGSFSLLTFVDNEDFPRLA